MKKSKLKFKKGDWIIGRNGEDGHFCPHEARKIIRYKKLSKEFLYYDPQMDGKKGVANNGNIEQYLRLATKSEIKKAKENGA